MTSAKELFVAKKNELIGLLEDSALYFSALEKNSEAEACRELAAKTRDGEFSIVVVGEFSSGKSTFLNALMGGRFLPSYSSETTATINYLRHINRAEGNYRGCVHYADGTKKDLPEISLAILEQYTCTKGDTADGKVAERVKSVDLFFESRYLEDNVTLVDSPGLNGVADHHRDLTEAQINKSHACIFVLCYDKPGSKTEFEFLKTLEKRIPNILFVLNKIDNERKDEEGLDHVIASVKTSYKQVFPDNKTIPRIWPLSARQALNARTGQDGETALKASRIIAFEERLWEFLTRSEKAHNMLASPLKQFINMGKNERDRLEANLAVLNDKRDAAGIEEKIGELQEAIDRIAGEKAKIHGELLHDIKTVERDTREAIKAKLERFRAERLRRLEAWDDIDDLNDILNVLPAIERKIGEISRDCEETFYDGLRELAFQKYTDLVSQIQGEQHDFNIAISREVPITETEINVGIEQYLEKIAAMEAEVSTMEETLDKANMDKLAVLREERALKEKKAELREAKDRKSALESSYSLPPVEYRTRQVENEAKHGLLSGLFRVLVGGSKPTYHEETETDDSARREAQKRFDQQKAEHNAEIEKYENDISNLRTSGHSAEEIDLQIARKEKAIADYRERIAKEKAAQLAEFEQKKNKKLFQIRRDMTDYIDDVSDDLLSAFDKGIENIGRANAGSLTDLISSKLEDQLKRKQGEIETQRTLLESSEEDKKAKIDENSALLERINALLNQAVSLESAVTSEDIDKLEEEAI